MGKRERSEREREKGMKRGRKSAEDAGRRRTGVKMWKRGRKRSWGGKKSEK